MAANDDLSPSALAAYKDQYEKEGYVILPSPVLLDESELVNLREAAERVTSKTRNGEWTSRRIVGKQFPPFDTKDERPDVWGVQHIMHYGLHEPAFAKWYGSAKLVKVMAHLLGCTEQEVQMELFNLLVNPSEHSFALRWHRDDVREEANEEEESEILHASHYGIQWNTALYDDACLYVVPRSHLIVSTPEQRALSTTKNTPDDPLKMPGSISVQLKPGDTVIYNNNILHTGSYSPSLKRQTLHACMGNTRGGGARARNILQHDLRWMRTKEFEESLSSEDKAEEERLKGMWDLLMRMDKSVGGMEKVGYSQA